MFEIKFIVYLAILFAIFNSNNMVFQIVFLIFIIFSFLYSKFKVKGKNTTITNTTIVFNQNKDKLNIEKDGNNILEDKQSVETTNNLLVKNLVVIIKQVYSFSVVILDIIYIKFLIIAILTTIWVYIVLYLFDFEKNINLEILFVPYCLLFFNSIRILYLFKKKYNNISNRANDDYLKISISEIPYYILMFILYYLMMNYNNIRISHFVNFTHIILPMLLILVLQTSTMLIFYKKQKCSIDYNFYNYISNSRE